MFFYNFPLDFARRVWDFIISKKDFALVLVALGIVKAVKRQILDMKL